MTATPRIPPRILYGDQMSTLMLALISGVNSRMACYNPGAGNAEMHSLISAVGARDASRNPGNTELRRVMGYPLPTWQREIKWTDTQNERFIKSVYSGVYLGLFIYNDAISTAPHLDGLLIDGQQRLNAIERYLADDFALAAPNGDQFYWSELTEDERSHFYRMNFNFQVVRISDEQQLKDLYNILNFGGTPHLPLERA